MRLFAAAALIAFAHCAAAFDFPEGWRLPTADELGAEPLRLESETIFAQVQADLDGDGVLDDALLLKKTHANGEGLLVRLSSTSTDRWLLLAEFEWGDIYPDVDLVMSVGVVEPNVHMTACGKGYWECAPSEPTQIKLVRPRLLYFKFESFSTVFFWNQVERSFKHVLVSD